MSTRAAENYGEKIRHELQRWDIYNTGGGCDPFWPDGANMELCRSHIIHYRTKIEEELEPSEYPEEYYLELPPEVSRSYMAKADDIRKNASDALTAYLENADYQYLISARGKLNAVQKKESCIEAAKRARSIISNRIAQLSKETERFTNGFAPYEFNKY